MENYDNYSQSDLYTLSIKDNPALQLKKILLALKVKLHKADHKFWTEKLLIDGQAIEDLKKEIKAFEEGVLDTTEESKEEIESNKMGSPFGG